MIDNIRMYSRSLVREWNLLRGSFQNTGFHYSQCHALLEIEQHGSLATSQLSQHLLLDKSTTSRILHQLLDAGLVKVQKDAADGRQKWYSLTSKGKDVLQQNNCLADQQVEAAIKILGEKEQKLVLEGLRLYSKALTNSRKQEAFRIRPIQESDVLVVAQLIRQVMVEYGTVGEGYSINDPEIDDMYQAYQGPRSVFYVLEKGSKILGCGGLGPLSGSNENICELRKMYFLSEARGFGLGKKFLLQCLEDARRFAYKECYLETVERMWQANLLYKKMGFKRLERRCGDTGHSSCETYYSLKL